MWINWWFVQNLSDHLNACFSCPTGLFLAMLLDSKVSVITLGNKVIMSDRTNAKVIVISCNQQLIFHYEMKLHVYTHYHQVCDLDNNKQLFRL